MRISKGITLLRQALKYYEDQEAEGDAIYRDALTDLLHLYKEDTRRDVKDYKGLFLSAHSNFISELEEEELNFIQSIKTKDLPLYLNKEWDFPCGSDYFQERIKNELGTTEKSSPTLERSKKRSR